MSNTETGRHDWFSSQYVSDWIERDVLHDLLALPRRISVGLVRNVDLEVGHIVDLGAGPGTYLQAFLESFPDAQGLWIDASEPMEQAARDRLADFGDRVSYVQVDASEPSSLDLPPAEVITTSRMVHHFSPEATRALYRTVREALVPGGWFFNLDHFSSPPNWEEPYRATRKGLTGKNPTNPHAHEYPRQPLDTHLEWLRAVGFETPVVPWKAFFTALVVARAPE